MPDEREQPPAEPNHHAPQDPLAAAILAQVGLHQSALLPGPQQAEAEAALRHPAWGVRTAAVQALAERGEHAPIAPLVAALQDDHAAVRAAAARALGRLGNRTPVEPLVAALRDSAWPVRTAAALSLGNLRQRTPVEPLVATLNDADESVRAAAVWALGRLGNRTPVEPLVAALRDSAWPVREAAAFSLQALGRRAPVAPLLAAHLDQDSQVREAAGWALEARLGTPPGADQERNRTMSQQVGYEEQAYQAPTGFNDPLYRGQPIQPGARHPLFGQWFAPAGVAVPNPPRYRVIVALGSLVTLLLVVIAMLAASGPYETGFGIIASLIALGMVCATIVAINIAFNLRH